jgi:hypothetical protein
VTDTPIPETEEEPLFRHTCSACKFLGTAERDGRHFDLYFCDQGHLIPTVIARGSNQPHDYTSGMSLVAHDALLFEAFERAKRRGFIPADQHADAEFIENP